MIFHNRPVTVQRIKAAYEACGLQPMQGDFAKDDSCCGLGALAISEGGINKEWMIELIEAGDPYREVAHEMGISVGEVYSFAYGFDGLSFGSLKEIAKREGFEVSLDAFKLGEDAWNAVSQA